MYKTLGIAVLLTLTMVSSAFAAPVPEIDAGTAQYGIALLAGGVAVLMGRRRK